MKLVVELALERSVADLMDLGAVAAVTSTTGGTWLDGGQPVDLAKIEELAATIDADSPTGEERVCLRSGVLDWDRSELEGTVDDRDFSARISVELRSKGGDRTTAVVRLKVRPRRLLFRVVAPVVGPFVRHYLTKEIGRIQEGVARDLATIPPIRLQRSSRRWTFHADPHAPISSVLRSR